jgi:hypothetical protein
MSKYDTPKVRSAASTSLWMCSIPNLQREHAHTYTHQ